MASIAQKDTTWQIIEISRQWSGSGISESQVLQRKGYDLSKKMGSSMPFAVEMGERAVQLGVNQLEEQVGALVSKRG